MRGYICMEEELKKEKNIVSIIGAGAAGCFCAIELKCRMPNMDVHVYERGTKALAKVAVTGGGRCNLTNSFSDFIDDYGRYTDLQLAYPRGDKLMRRMLGIFSHEDTMKWFEREGVKLVTQTDECVFPQSQDAMEIVNTLLKLMRRNGVNLHLGMKLVNIEKNDEMDYNLFFEKEKSPISSNYVIITSGGGKAPFLQSLDIKMTETLPSLFTFNLTGAPCQELMGTVVEDTVVGLGGTKIKARGPLLWTHWGVSGPAILKLSSYAARLLAEREYKGTLTVNWCGGMHETEVRERLSEMLEKNANKNITNSYPTFLTQKHWLQMLAACTIPHTQRCGALNATQINRLVNTLTAQQLTISGRCHYKEEFVTCGGVALSELSTKTLEHKKHKGLYFAGEATDVDAITGGFNLQAAWSMGYVVAKSIADE